ncbi:hypothetical protein V8F06_006534 [Rhypophila decipiens]
MVKLKTLTSRALLGAIPLAKLPTLPGNSTSLNGINVLATGECDIGEVVCGLGCMPLTGVCCGTTGYCDLGEYCTVRDTCCPVGKVCRPGGSCDPGETLCNGGCMPSTGVCCSDGGYCDAGETCTAQGTCARGGSGGGSSGGGGGSSGGGSGSGTCSAADNREACDDKCMLLGAVCCGDGDGSYCDAGYYCTPTGCCREGRVCTPGSAGGGSGGGSSDDETTTTTTSTTSDIFTAPTPTTGPATGDEDIGDGGGAVQPFPTFSSFSFSDPFPPLPTPTQADSNNNGPGSNNFPPASAGNNLVVSVGRLVAAGFVGAAALLF